tara:strand:- start:456 stop:1772 length:1317 start_codon:yes stop_codon:yes gene_type:complete
MFGQLQDRFTKIFKTIKGHGKISEKNVSDAIREIRVALLESDVNFKVVGSFIERVKAKATGLEVFDSITPGQQFVKIVLDEMIDFLSSENSELKIKHSNAVILLAGLQGSGKTTTAAKIASFLKREFNKKPLLVGLDLQRPGAMDQLKTLAQKNQIDFYIEKKSKDCIEVLKNSLVYAKEIKSNLVILDTAGRLHIDDFLIKELKEIINISNPDEILYISDGMTGQDAVNSSKVFMENCNLTGCILTKMDGDSGGGAALSIKEVTGVPIKYITYGEDILDIEKFNPDSISRRILGLSDILGLVEKAQKSFDQSKLKDIQDKLIKDEFDLNDFKTQLNQMENMGGMKDLMKFIPSAKKFSKADIDDNKIKWITGIINSMTKLERLKPEIINGERRKRIARGCGRSLQEVNQLLKQFNQMKVMMKKMKKTGMNKFPFNLR